MGRQEGKLRPGRGIDGLLGRRWLSLTQSAGKPRGLEIGGKKTGGGIACSEFVLSVSSFLTYIPPAISLLSVVRGGSE